MQKKQKLPEFFSLTLAEIAVCFVFFCIAAGIRFVLLFQNMDYDEAYTYLVYVSQGYWASWTTYNLPNNHILNSILGVLSTSILGGRPEVLRFFPLLFGVFSLPLFYYVLRKFFSQSTSLMASIVAWCSFYLVMYSAQARGYSAQVFFFYLSLILFFYGSVWWMLSLSIVCMALALFAIPTTLFPLFIFALILLLKGSDVRKTVGWVFGTGFLTALLYFPAMIYVLVLGTKTFGFKEAVTFEMVMEKVQRIIVFIVPTESWMIVSAAVTFFLLGLAFAFRRENVRPLSLGLVIALPVLAFVYPSSLVFERLWIWFIPIFYAFVFFAFEEIIRWAISEKATRQFLFLFFCCVGVFTLKTSYQNAHIGVIRYENTSESLHDNLAKVVRPGDFIVLSQSLVTELNYWASLSQRAEGWSRFLIQGDWQYSLYRQPADSSILKMHVGANKFYILHHAEEQLQKGLQMTLDYINMDVSQKKEIKDLQIQKLDLGTRKASVTEVTLL